METRYGHTKESFQDYAADMFDVPAGIGYFEATGDCISTIEHFLAQDLSHEALKQKLREYIDNRYDFIEFADPYMVNQEYKKHPHYIAEQQAILDRKKNRPVDDWPYPSCLEF